MSPIAQKLTRWVDGYLLSLGASFLILAGCSPSAPSGSGSGSGNNPPTANAGADQTVNAGATVTLDGSASSDPDRNTLTFSWTQTSGTSVSLSSTSAATVTFTAPTNGTTLVFQLTVSDGQSTSTGTVHVSVRPVEQSAQVDEILQRSVTDDPAVMGNFPNGWAVQRPNQPATPADESEQDEFREQYADHKVLFAPTIEEDLAPGASETVELPVAGPSGLSGLVRWVGTIDPLDVTLALDGSTLAATGTTYHFGPNRGGSLVNAQTTAGGRATMTVTNTSDATVKVRIVFTAAGV